MTPLYTQVEIRRLKKNLKKMNKLLWLRGCQKKPGCSKPALLSAAWNAAWMKHQQAAQGRIKQPLHCAWDIGFAHLTGILSARQGTCVPDWFFVTVSTDRSNTEKSCASWWAQLLWIQNKGQNKRWKKVKQFTLNEMNHIHC